MTYAVRYYTKTGNTKRLAEAMAKELGVEALPISEPLTLPMPEGRGFLLPAEVIG